jgi:hypothetical protein
MGILVRIPTGVSVRRIVPAATVPFGIDDPNLAAPAREAA